MKKSILAVSVAMLLAVGMTSLAAAQSKEGAAKDAKPGGVVVDVTKLSGTVKAIDMDKKMVTIEGSGGKTVVVDAKNARNLDQVKVGDKVNLAYIESIALFLRKSDAPPSVSETQDMALAPKGEKPGGLVTKTIELTGSVESIDMKKRTVVVKGPAGNVRTFKVSPDAKNLGQVKKGDQVVLRYTEALALSVTKP